MIDAYKKYWKNYANFDGKSSRGDFWWAFLACLIVEVIIGIVMGIILAIVGDKGANIISFIEGLWALANFIPSISIRIRRFRDGGHSWVNIFWSFLPIIGGIIIIVKLCDSSK